MFGAKPGFVQHHPSDAHIVVPDAHLLFSGNYVRIGSDLIISSADQKFVVGNYFKGEARPALISNDGATLSGQIVDALTGHVHYAQAAGAAPAAAQVIGHVLKMSGSATAIRNGVSIELHIGDAVQKGDVVQTGSDSSIGMTFVDGSAFGMTSNARMVLNEMIYDPNGSSNSSLISLVQGTITFVAGQTAKNGNMRVETPVATMGIRGTAVLVEIAADNGPTKFSVLVEPDGHTGSYNLYDKTTGQLIGTVSQAGQVTFVSVGGIGQPPTAIEQLKTLQDQQQEKALIQQVFQLYFPNYNPDNSNPKSQKFGSTSYNNLAEITFTTTTNQQHTFLTQIELRFAFTDPLTGITTYTNRLFYNSKASFSAIPVFGDQAFEPTSETFRFIDVVRIDDPDIGNAPFYDIGVPFVAGSAVILSATSTTSAPGEAALKDLLTINQTTGEVTFDRQDFNFLDDGETVEYVIRVTATSGPDTGSVEIHVTINGANDEPVFGAPVAVDLHEIGIVPPDTVPPTGGDGVLQQVITLHFTDADFTETGGNYVVEVSEVSTTGSTAGFDVNTLETTLRDFFSFASTPVTKDVNSVDGSIHGTFSADDKAFDYLAEGEQLVITYTVELTEQDHSGAHFYQTFTVTITGANDVPTIAIADVTQTDTIYEIPGQTGGTGFDHNANDDIPSGSIHFVDADLTDRPEVSTTSQVITYLSADGEGDLTNSLTQGQRSAIEAAFKLSVPTGQNANTNYGVVNWTYELVDNVLDFLAEGETIKLVSTVRVSDGHGGFADATVTINIVGGANDTPSIAAIADVALNEQTDTGSLHQTIAVDFIDVDLSDTGHVASVQSVTASGVLPPFVQTGPLISGTFFDLLTAGQAQKAAGGSSGSASFSFDADSTTFDYLAVGDTVTLTYTVAITDQNNATGTQTVAVTITGTNDDAIVSVAPGDHDAGAVTEDAPPSAQTGSETTSGTISFTDVDLNDTHSVTGVTASVGALGHLIASISTDSTHGATGVLTWNYTVANSAIQYLAAGEHKDETFTVSVFDGTSTVTKDVVVTITGTNDVPVIAGIAAGEVTEDSALDSGNLVANGLLTINDADHDQSAFVAQASTAGSNGYGTFSVDVNGHWTYTADNSQTAIQQLGDGESLTDTFTVHSFDGTADQVVTVTIHGTNDVPVIAGVAGGDVTEDTALDGGNLVANGLLTINDADHDQSTFVAQASTAGSNGYGAFTLDAAGHWTYTADNSLTAIQQLGDGQSLTDAFTVHSSDGSADQLVTVTIHGTNDAPAMNIDNVTPVELDGNGVMKVSGVTVSDVDAGSDTFSVTAVADNGSVATVGGHSLDPDVPGGGVTGTFAQITSLFTDGAIYTPNYASLTDTDKVTLTVTDGHSGTDTVNFIFKQYEPNGGVTLNGTTGKDWILSSTGDDFMTGNGGGDNFVFAAQSGQDTIINFHSGTDHIVLNGYGTPFTDETSFNAWLDTQVTETSGNAVIHLDANDSITLTSVAKANLSAHDFIIHPAGA